MNKKILSAATFIVLLFAIDAAARSRGSAVSISPAFVAFGNQAVYTSSLPTTVKLANNSGYRISIVNVSLSLVEFTYSGPSLPITLNPGESFTGTVTFSPSAAQSYSDNLTFTRANGSTVAIPLSGTGGDSSPVPPSPVQPTSLQLTTAPCDSNFNCVPGTAAAVGQFVKITAHVVYSGTINPTGQVCIVDNGSPVNCGLTPVADENWFTNGLTAGKHTLTATYAGDSVYSESKPMSAVLTVGSAAIVAPNITTQPANQNITVGQTATFSVAATGTAPLSYQWKKNGTAIIGATSATYTTPVTTASDNGSQIVVTVSNSAGSMTSNAAILTISSGSSQLTVSPSSLTFGPVNLGTSSTLSATLTNAGTSSATISNVSVSGPGFNATGASGITLGPGQNQILNVTFAPSGTGNVSGRVTVTSNATNSPMMINLSGSGVQPTVSSITVTPADQTVPVGTQVQFTAMDNFGNDITASVIWSSSDTSVVSITATGLATGLTDGIATISAGK
jgi:hypothetical protein